MYDESHLAHYGVKGMKWGVHKRYVDESGRLTTRGRRRYGGRGGRERLARDINSNTRKGKNIGAAAGAGVNILRSTKYATAISDNFDANHPIASVIGSTAAIMGRTFLDVGTGYAVGSVADHIASRTMSDLSLTKEYQMADEILRRSGIA